MVASIELTTERKPFTAHAHATNSRRCSVVSAITRSPIGMKAPSVSPSGAITRIASTRRSGRATPTKRSLMLVAVAVYAVGVA